MSNEAIGAVRAFLGAPTPAAWFDVAAGELELLLIDHANCEKKAASTALGMLYRYVDRPDLQFRLSRLAREELRHFEQVHALMQARGVAYRHLTAGRYAGRLMGQVRRDEPGRLTDTLLVGALVEARSCERFAGLAGLVPDDLGRLYRGLLASEARHFGHYLALARRHGTDDLEWRLAELRSLEADLATAPDTELRFHSGPVAEPALRPNAAESTPG